MSALSVYPARHPMAPAVALEIPAVAFVPPPTFALTLDLSHPLFYAAYRNLLLFDFDSHLQSTTGGFSFRLIPKFRDDSCFYFKSDNADRRSRLRHDKHSPPFTHLQSHYGLIC